MTINYSCTSSNVTRSRLPFGVPLEDISPCNDLHPYLKVILTKAYRDIRLNGYTVEEVLSKLQGTIAERLALKEIVASCKPMPSEVPPGILLWILRHFIGLLPLPLLPDYTNGQHFSWARLAQFCKRSFMKYTSIEVNNRLLITKLAGELSRLPSANLLLLSVLLNFIRALSRQRGRGTRNFNRLAAFYLVRYFSASIFRRPYNPGCISKLDRHYFPLLLYLVLKWPAIKDYFEPNAKCSPTLAKIPPIYPYRYLEPTITKIKIKDVYTQTDDYFDFDDASDVISEDNCFKSISQTSNLDETYIDAISDVAAEKECIFLRDTGCQTDESLKECHIKHDYFSHGSNIQCCCSYGSNYESSLNENQSLDKYCQTSFLEDDKKSFTGVTSKFDVSTCTDRILPSKYTQCELNRVSTSTLRPSRHQGTNTDDTPYYGWISPYGSPKSTLNRTDLCSTHTFISHSEYIYDDYASSNLNLLGNTEETNLVDGDSDVLGRIAKIGWTYTPPTSAGPTSPTTTSKSGLKEEIYTPCYNEKECKNTEDKENCSSRESLKSKQSIGNVSPAKSKKSFTVANIKSKLDFFKIFTAKKNKLQGSCSFEEISNIKYKRMNSARSTMF